MSRATMLASAIVVATVFALCVGPRQVADAQVTNKILPRQCPSGQGIQSLTYGSSPCAATGSSPQNYDAGPAIFIGPASCQVSSKPCAFGDAGVPTVLGGYPGSPGPGGGPQSTGGGTYSAYFEGPLSRIELCAVPNVAASPSLLELFAGYTVSSSGSYAAHNPYNYFQDGTPWPANIGFNNSGVGGSFGNPTTPGQAPTMYAAFEILEGDSGIGEIPTQRDYYIGLTNISAATGIEEPYFASARMQYCGLRNSTFLGDQSWVTCAWTLNTGDAGNQMVCSDAGTQSGTPLAPDNAAHFAIVDLSAITSCTAYVDGVSAGTVAMSYLDGGLAMPIGPLLYDDINPLSFDGYFAIGGVCMSERLVYP
jgi:hypothetical protein